MDKFVFFYSPLYNYYYNHLNKNLSLYFYLESILIDDLQAPKKDKIHTFRGGISIKIEIVIKKIKENLGKFIIFSDATIFVNTNLVDQLPVFFNRYKCNDLTFANNFINEDFNIGLILIKCTQETLSFFEKVLEKLKNTKNSWDQEIVNQQIKENNILKISKFCSNSIMCRWKFDNQYRDSFLIFKSFIRHKTDKKINFNLRLEILRKNNLISEQEYQENIQ